MNKESVLNTVRHLGNVRDRLGYDRPQVGDQVFYYCEEDESDMVYLTVIESEPNGKLVLSNKLGPIYVEGSHLRIDIKSKPYTTIFYDEENMLSDKSESLFIDLSDSYKRFVIKGTELHINMKNRMWKYCDKRTDSEKQFEEKTGKGVINVLNYDIYHVKPKTNEEVISNLEVFGKENLKDLNETNYSLSGVIFDRYMIEYNFFGSFWNFEDRKGIY
ncbi:MAG: hypothetical protein N4A40_13115 [Tissierellales bacterium]|jgi:hypothetical protein|nr:hypothetical protein [Tissierellales bacterium]